MSFKQKCSIRLVKSAKRGNKFALTQIYQSYKSAIYGFAFLMLKNTDSASDVTQNVVVKMIENIVNLKDEEQLGSWLKTITYNTTIDYIRKNAKYQHSEVDHNQTENLELANQKHSQMDLSKILDCLNERARLVVWLFSVEGLTHLEIAKKLSISSSNSKQIFKRSMAKLKSQASLASYNGRVKNE